MSAPQTSNRKARLTVSSPSSTPRAKTKSGLDFQEISNREAHHLEGVQERVGGATIAYVPFLASDVHDFEGLREIGRILFDE